MKHRATGKKPEIIGETEVDLGRHIGFLVRKIYQKNQAIWQELCPDPQLTSTQFAVLEVVWRNGPSSLTEIGRSAAMDPATTRGVVDRLRSRGLIELEDDTLDRRKVIVRLEPAGHAMVRTMESVMPQIAEATLHPLNAAERLALRFVLLKATENGEEAIPGPPAAGPGLRSCPG